MKTKLFITPLLSVFFFACAVGSDADVSDRPPLEIGFTGTEEQYIEAVLAAYAWNTTCDRDLVHVELAPRNIELRGVEGRVDKKNALGAAFCNRKSSPEILFQTDTPEPLRTILAHEFGHFLLACSNERDHAMGGIMRAAVAPDMLDAEGNIAPGQITPEHCAAALRR